ncbi:MAG: DUF350 domain-containing protein [Oligoflexia bacterium]|nr:DUF350 domain-containing protein [Oligoflexia bacterium]
MNEIFDKLLLRIFIAFTLCFALFLYKFSHILLHPSAKQYLLKKFYPSQNPADTLYLFGRIIGVGIIFSGLYFNIENNFLHALVVFFIQGIVVFVIYLVSIYILESITLYNFDYSDEIIRRKNMSYAIVVFTESICIGIIIKTAISVANGVLTNLLFLWPLSLVLLGISAKTFNYLSKLPFNKLLIRKNMALAFSFSGHILGPTMIIVTSMQEQVASIENYVFQVFLKILLSIIILPIFLKALKYIFRMHDDLLPEDNNPNIKAYHNFNDENNTNVDSNSPSLGYGLYEGGIFFTSCFLTSVITTHILFGNFYPNF